MGKTLITYYSRAGYNYFGGKIINIDVGNTEIIANKLHDLTGADIIEIKQKVAYSDDYKECVKQARDDLKNDSRPEIINMPESISDYDKVIVAFPNYCGTMPMAVWTFLESYDFTNKTIYPLCSNEGSGLGRSENDIKSLAHKSILGDGLSVFGSRAKECDNELKNWLEKIKL